MSNIPAPPMAGDGSIDWERYADGLEGKVIELHLENERLRAKVERVEEAVEVIHGTRHALPPMDASECVVILRQALKD